MRLLALTAFLVILGQAQVGPDPAVYNSARRIFWEHSGLDVNGQPETLGSGELQLLDAAGAVVGGTSCPALPPTQGLDILPLMQGRKPGDYQLRVRVYDMAGNVSDWSVPLALRVDGGRPAPPTNLRTT